MEHQCKYCGTIVPNSIIELKDNDEVRIVCPRCYSAFNTCGACQHAICAFDNYRGPLPQFIMRTIQRGNMIAQTQAPNPEVIKVTCMAGCACYEEGADWQFCHLKDGTGWCPKYKEVD